MKRNKNFFLMWMALVALFTVTPQAKANSENKLYVPKDFGLYWVKNGEHYPLTVDPSNFIESVTDYSAQIPFRADTFYLGVKWSELTDNSNVDSIPVTVMNGNSIIKGIGKTTDGDGGLNNGHYGGHYDSVYVIPFKDESDVINGSLSFTVAGTNYKYNLTVTRVAKSSISSLIKLAVVAADTTNADISAAWKTNFEKVNLFTEAEKEETDSVFFKYLNDSIKIVEPGEYVEEDSIDASQKIALVLREKDVFSKVKVVQLGKEITRKNYKFAGDCSVYEIEPGSFVSITVTAEDGTTKSEYKVKIFARPAESFEDEQKNKVIGKTPRLDSLYLLDSKDGFYKLDKNFHPDTTEYKITIPQEFAANAVVGYVWDTTKLSSGTGGSDTIFIGTLKYEFHEGDPAYYEVKVLSLDGRTLVKPYKITVRYPNLSLKSFVLRDSADKKDLVVNNYTFHPDTLGYKLTLKYNEQDSISVHLAVADTHAKVELNGLSEEKPSGSEISTSAQEKAAGIYKFRIPVGKAKDGIATSVFTVRDGSVEREYRLSLVKDWNLRLEKLVLKDGAGTFSVPVALEDDLYEYREAFPTNVKLEDITVEAEAVEKSVFKTWSVIKDNDNYFIRVKTFDPGRTKDKIYTVKVESYSSDATLKLLSVTPDGKLSPAFHSDTTQYSVTVPSAQEYIYIVAVPNHGDADVEGNGGHNLNSDSTFTVTVTAEDETTKKDYFIKVTRDSGTGILPLSAQSVQVYADGPALHVITPAAERVGIYSVSGKLLYSLDKPAGKASVSGIPKGILIVKGSSGWVEKAVVR